MMSLEAIIHIVDDDPAIRDSLSLLLKSAGFESRTYASAEDFLSSYKASRPGCLLLDIRMPGMNGLDLQEELASRRINTPVIIMTGDGDVPAAVRAMKAGSLDFIEKPFDPQFLLDLVKIGLAKDVKQRKRRKKDEEISSRLAALSSREREILDLLAAGEPNKMIARKLDISPRTVELHRSHIMRKLHAHSLSDLVRLSLIANGKAKI